MELITTKEEFKDLKDASKTNIKIKDLLATLREFDLISIDEEHGVIAIHSNAIPTIINRAIS